MLGTQFVQSAQQPIWRKLVYSTRRPTPRIGQAQECIGMGKARLTQHFRQRLQKSDQGCPSQWHPVGIEAGNARIGQFAFEPRRHFRIRYTHGGVT